MGRIAPMGIFRSPRGLPTALSAVFRLIDETTAPDAPSDQRHETAGRGIPAANVRGFETPAFEPEFEIEKRRMTLDTAEWIGLSREMSAGAIKGAPVAALIIEDDPTRRVDLTF